MTNLTAPKEIEKLIERFQENRDVYCSSEYNEAQARIEFIDPLFKALGWDMTNKKGYAEAYKEVIHEDAIKVGGATKAPDYAFRIGGVRKFFVEAKRPGVNIKEDGDAAYQLRRYAWSAKLPLSIVTDFEEFAVYDSRIKPAKTDKASVGRVLYLTVDQYDQHWDEIAQIFSQDAILTGSFDRYAESTKRKKGTAEVDTAFLNEIEAWRDVLARNIALRNGELSTRELNFAVQRTIDRIIFLRICEDRGIEQYGQLMALQNGTNTYQRLCQIFRRADERYNSGLFHFGREKDRLDPPDNLTLNLTIDDNLIKGIIKGLYYPESPFEFSVLPADILGHIYEQFLGKVIRLTAGHHAKVEDKPEVKKAGGVYYTPTYIVDYIVKNTVGKLVEQNTPTKVSNLSILDPACGSGSFLLGAYQTLLDWHQEWYAKHDPEKHAKGKNPRLYRTIDPSPSGRGQGEGAWRLTTAERKRILLNNIYGVDIDTQAVEVTKLSLLLKVLEGENAETLGKNLRLFHERALPDLGDNIKCGNSLIGPDFYEGKQISLLDEEERYRINAFDWEAEFPEIMQAGGFDAVIGNPPYGAAFSGTIRHHLSSRFRVPVPIADSYVLFMLKSLELIRDGGVQSFIVPSPWLYMPSYFELRRRLLSDFAFKRVMVFREPVFPKATVETCVEVVSRMKADGSKFVFLEVSEDPRSLAGEAAELSQDQVHFREGALIWYTNTGVEGALFRRIAEENPRLSKLATIVCGLTPYRKGKGSPPQTERIVAERAFDASCKEGETYRRYIMGRDFHRYRWAITKERWISYGDWLAEPRRKAPFDDPIKIVIRQTADLIVANIDTNQFLSLKNVHNLRITNDTLAYQYLLGVLNSKLISWWYRRLIPEKGRVFAEVKVVNLKKLPVHTIDFSNSADKARQDRMVELVETMLKLHKQLAAAKTNHEKTAIQRQIAATDKQIDQLVYELYSLTEEEIRIVEEAASV